MEEKACIIKKNGICSWNTFRVVLDYEGTLGATCTRKELHDLCVEFHQKMFKRTYKLQLSSGMTRLSNDHLCPKIYHHIVRSLLPSFNVILEQVSVSETLGTDQLSHQSATVSKTMRSQFKFKVNGMAIYKIQPGQAIGAPKLSCTQQEMIVQQESSANIQLYLRN